MTAPQADPPIRALMVVVLIAASITAARYELKLSFPIDDAFHNGEFLAAAMAILHQAPFEGDPFTIHGAADILPALAAALFVPAPDDLIAHTLVLYPVLSLLSILLTLFAALQIVRRLGGDHLLLIPFLALVPFAVGWRDLFFALSLSLFAGLVPGRDSRGGGVAAQMLFGVVIALGTYWSFNRGAAALLAFGPVTLWLALQDRRFLVSVATALVSFVAIGAVLPGIGVVGYVENFAMLLETSSQWTYPPSRFGQAWTAALSAAFAASAAAAFIALRQRGPDRGRIALTMALVIAGAIYLKIGLGRIDRVHIVMAAWLPLLIMSVSLRWGPVPLPQGWAKRCAIMAAILVAAMAIFLAARYSYAVHAMVLATFMILLGAFLPPRGRFGVGVGMAVLFVAFAASAPAVGMYKIVRGDVAWPLSLDALPANDGAVTEEVLWTAQRIDQSGADCVFDLTNTGLVNAVAGLPSCSRFTYPVYADTDFEDDLISDLRAADPPMIVYRSDHWSYAIDGHPMNERFPKLDAEIQRVYPRQECHSGVCLRYQE